MRRSQLKPSFLARLRCHFLGHFYKFSGMEPPNAYNGTGYIVHTSCLRCGKVRTLTNPATSIAAKRAQE